MTSSENLKNNYHNNKKNWRKKENSKIVSITENISQNQADCHGPVQFAQTKHLEKSKENANPLANIDLIDGQIRGKNNFRRKKSKDNKDIKDNNQKDNRKDIQKDNVLNKNPKNQGEIYTANSHQRHGRGKYRRNRNKASHSEVRSNLSADANELSSANTVSKELKKPLHNPENISYHESSNKNEDPHSHDCCCEHVHSHNHNTIQAASKRHRKRYSKSDGKKNQKHNHGTLDSNQNFSAFSRIRGKPSAQKSSVSAALVDITNLSPTQIMIYELNNGKYECCICSMEIGKKQQTWVCSKGCRAPYHLSCTKQWATAQKDSYSIWKCPLCSESYNEIPTDYFCWCQKQRNPYYNASIPTHSCGNVCGEKYDSCPHTCNMICHPGIHPPCEGVQQTTCSCGKETMEMKCQEVANNLKFGKKISCGKVCGKVLNCALHTCPLVCGHEGDCPSCTLVIMQTCYCGKHTEERSCIDSIRDFSSGNVRTFSCEELCDKGYDTCDCRCTKTCHPGSCGECPLYPDNVKFCQCGKTPLASLLKEPRKLCSDPIPTCRLKHGAPMPCGMHNCTRTCHASECGDCFRTVTIKCGCGKTNANLPCVFTYIDWEKTTKENPAYAKLLTDKYLKPNGIKSWPLQCKSICNSYMHCLRHKCNNICCTGGEAHICQRMCKRSLNCKKHKCDLHCHAGNCPGCSRVMREPIICRCGKTKLDPPQICGVELPPCPHECSIERECGHPVNHLCHETDSCPPCQKKISKMCVGSHGLVHDIPCSLQDPHCTSECRKVLSCGNPDHLCKKECHAGSCSVFLPGQSCSFLCMKELSCGHKCQRICHPETECNNTTCTQILKVFCDCRRIKKNLECSTVMKLLKEKFPNDEYIIHDIPDFLECDSECERVARNEGLAEALGVDVLKCNLPAFSQELIDFGRTDTGLKFIEQVELALEAFLEDRKRQLYIFPPMGREKRVIIHTITDYYRITSASVDVGSNRSIHVTKTSGSRFPKYLLSEVLKDPLKMEKLQLKLKEIEQNNEQYNSTTTATSVAYQPREKSKPNLISTSNPHNVESLDDVESGYLSQLEFRREREMTWGSGMQSKNRWSSFTDAESDSWKS